MTVEAIIANRKEFSEQVFEVATTDMYNMGISVISYTVKDVTDDNGYLLALGKGRTAIVKRDARIGLVICILKKQL
jgi:flotillin